MYDQKRGQVALFIIVAVVLIGAVSIYFVIISQEETEIAQRSDSPVYLYVESCIQDAAFLAVEAFGRQQGYYIVPESRSIETVIYRMAYYYLEGETLVPTNEFFQKEFSKILNDEIIIECSDFSNFEEDGSIITFDANDIETTTRIFENEVVLNVNYPITVRDNESSVSFSRFSYTLPVRLGHIIDVSRTLVEKIKEEPNLVDLTFFLNQDVSISISDYDECNKVYIILDEESQVNNEPYAFSFAVGFSEEYCVEV